MESSEKENGDKMEAFYRAKFAAETAEADTVKA
jgi:hypothetical protein